MKQANFLLHINNYSALLFLIKKKRVENFSKGKKNPAISQSFEEIERNFFFKKMVSANREMAVYCFDTLVAHYNSEDAPPPAFDEGQQ